jgi:hypothetical protein
MNWFKYATMVQIVVGIWFFLTLPGPVMGIYLGGNWLATVIIIIGIVCALIALYFSIKVRPVATALFLLPTVVFMAITRAFMRGAYLSPYYSPADLEVTHTYSSFILFAVTFVVGLAIVAYMLKLYYQTVKEA